MVSNGVKYFNHNVILEGTYHELEPGCRSACCYGGLLSYKPKATDREEDGTKCLRASRSRGFTTLDFSAPFAPRGHRPLFCPKAT